MGHQLRVVATVLALIDRERALQHVAVLDMVAEVIVRVPKIIQCLTHLLALRTKHAFLPR